MAAFQVFDPQVEVMGSSLLAMIAAIRSWPTTRVLAQNILRSYDVGQIAPDRWYPQQLALNLMRDLRGKLGSGVLYMIGKHLPEFIAFPPEATSIESALRAIDAAYERHHRGGESGSYTIANVQRNQIQIACYTPYPCDFDHGLIEGTARRFAPPQMTATVRHFPLRPCRRVGHTTCLYLVSWKRPVPLAPLHETRGEGAVVES